MVLFNTKTHSETQNIIKLMDDLVGTVVDGIEGKVVDSIGGRVVDG